MARDGETLVEAELRHVFVAADGSGKVPIPDAVRRGWSPNVRAEASRVIHLRIVAPSDKAARRWSCWSARARSAT